MVSGLRVKCGSVFVFDAVEDVDPYNYILTGTQVR
jgi:hypothetical protein